MKWSLMALVIGFIIDFFVGDPHGFPHPIILIGRLISTLEKGLRRLFPATAGASGRRVRCCGFSPSAFPLPCRH